MSKERIAELEAELESLREEEFAKDQAQYEVELKKQFAEFVSKNKKYEKFIKTLMKAKCLDENDVEEPAPILPDPQLETALLMARLELLLSQNQAATISQN